MIVEVSSSNEIGVLLKLVDYGFVQKLDPNIVLHPVGTMRLMAPEIVNFTENVTYDGVK